MDALKLGDKVVVADVGTYGLMGTGTVVATGEAVGKPVAYVRFPGVPLVKLVGYARYVVNKVPV